MEEFLLLLKEGAGRSVRLLSRWRWVAPDAHKLPELGCHLTVVILGEGHPFPDLGTGGARLARWLSGIYAGLLLGFLPEKLALLHLL